MATILGTRETFDGLRYSLVEEQSGGLAICDGNGIVPTRNHLSAAGWLAVWAEVSVLAAAELPGAMRRASKADRDGTDVRAAIHAPHAKAEAERLAVVANPPPARKWVNGCLVACEGQR